VEEEVTVKENPRYSRQLKSVYKSGVLAAIGGNNPIHDYYEYLIQEDNCPKFNARQKACRRLATLSLGVFKSGKKISTFQEEGCKKQREKCIRPVSTLFKVNSIEIG